MTARRNGVLDSCGLSPALFEASSQPPPDHPEQLRFGGRSPSVLPWAGLQLKAS